MRKGLLTLILSFVYGVVCSQHIISKKITTDDGLPSSEVYSIIQDKDGFIWIGTDNGLAKYDGKKFVLYSTNEGLPDNAILDIYEDVDGILWLSSMSKKIAFIKQGKIQKFDFNIGKSGFTQEISSPYIRGRDAAGVAWMNNIFGSIILKEVAPHEFKPVFPFASQEGEGQVTYWLKDIGKFPFKIGDVSYQFALVDNRSDSFKVETRGEFIHLQGPFPDRKLNNSLSFYRNRNGEYLGLSKNGDFIQFSSTQIIKFGKTGLKNTLNFYEDRAHNFWVLTQKGVAYFPGGNLDQTPEIFFPNFMITDMFHDREGNYWFADHNYGMYMSANIAFRQLQLVGAQENTRTTTIKVRNGKLWFSTIDGEVWKVGNDCSAVQVFSDKRPAYDFYPFEVLPNDELWLPGGRRVKNGRLIKVNAEVDHSYNNDKLLTLIDGEIYAGVTHGIRKFDVVGELKYNSELPINFGDKFIMRTNAVIRNNYGLWIGCTGGLYLYETDKDAFKQFGVQIPLLSSRIMALENMGKRHLIIGTKGAGVILFDMKNRTLKQLTIENGLISNMIRSVHLHKGNIYVGTNKGMSVIKVDEDYRPKSIINFDIHNGLPSNEISDIDFYDGKIWLATNRGVVFFDPKQLQLNSHHPPIFLEQVAVNDFPVSFTSSTLKLEKEQRKIVFSYNGIGFRSGNRIQYKYFLTDFDQDTTYTQNSTANYTNLSPGVHTFYVWARNEDGLWSSTPASLTVSIPKRFSETLWYLIVMLLAILGSLTIIFIYLYRRKRKKLEVELQTAELKQQALAALMNPHFVYNALAAIQHFINIDNIEKSNLYLSKFARLVRQNLNAVRNGFILLEDEIERLKLYLEIEKMRFGDKLMYEVQIDEELDLTGLEIPSMIIQPFVENAIWHGILPMDRPGRISVNFLITNDDLLEVFIEDNGPGIDKSGTQSEKEHHTSMSMEITRERLALLGQKTGRKYTIQVKQPVDGQGMVVHVRIPIAQLDA